MRRASANMCCENDDEDGLSGDTLDFEFEPDIVATPILAAGAGEGSEIDGGNQLPTVAGSGILDDGLSALLAQSTPTPCNDPLVGAASALPEVSADAQQRAKKLKQLADLPPKRLREKCAGAPAATGNQQHRKVEKGTGGTRRKWAMW